MYDFNAWLDQWVRDRRHQDRAADGGESRFPDDPEEPPGQAVNPTPRPPGPPPVTSSGGGDVVREVPFSGGGFAGFWWRCRSRPDLHNLSVAALRGLLGAREARFAGFLGIRDDLPPDHYLEIPFVRRCWRLLRALEGHERGEVPATAPVAGRSSSRGERSGDVLTFSWELSRTLDMNPATAHVNMRALLHHFLDAGFLELVDTDAPTRFLSDRARALAAAGSPGPFFKALCIRSFNRCGWNRDDALPPLVSVQLNGLFLLYALHATFRDSGGTAGATAMDLAVKIGEINRVIRSEEDPRFWVRDDRLLARVIHFRLLSRIGRMLGLIEPLVTPGVEQPSALWDQPFRPTRFAERVLQWNL